MVAKNRVHGSSPKGSLNRTGSPHQELPREGSYGDVGESNDDWVSHSNRSSVDLGHAGGRGDEGRDPATLRLLTSNLEHPSTSALPTADDVEQDAARTEKAGPVSWMSLPRKDQLVLLTLARLSEPLTQTSLQTYMFYQLRSFDPSLSDATISSQAGYLQGGFTAAQFLTAFMWGRIADSERGGRKRVLLIGLMGTAISAVGFGFSKSFATALCFRCLGGALNGNIGVMRTMISEIIKEKKYQSRAFLILPMTFNIGVIIGPILGGMLADPVGSYPSIFGPGSLFGGKNGVWWMTNWPYALPNLVSAVFLIASSTGVFLGLEETQEALRDTSDIGLRLGRFLYRLLFCRGQREGYKAIPEDDLGQESTINSLELQVTPTTPTRQRTPSQERTPQKRQKLPLRRIWTRNVISTLIAMGFLATHVGTFNNLWFIFLSAPRYDPAHPNPPSLKEQYLPIHFTGGLGLPPARVGAALAVLGTIGIVLQLILYPTLSAKLGMIRSYRYSLMLFPITYFLVPFLVMIPSSTKSPQPAGGILVWMGIASVLFIQVLARTFALPANVILVNNCCPHPSVLGTIHGIGQSVSSATRTIGPIVGGLTLGWGLRIGIVGIAWWGLAVIAIGGVIAGTFVRNGSGHEIVLEGEKEGD